MRREVSGAMGLDMTFGGYETKPAFNEVCHAERLALATGTWRMWKLCREGQGQG